MKEQIKSVLGKIIAPAAIRLGYQKNNNQPVENYRKNELLNNFFNILQQINFIPTHIVDVGANHGTWTREALRYFPDASHTLLEPQQQMRVSIADITQTKPKVTFNAVGAGSKAGQFMFTIVDRDDSCNFLYTAEEASRRGFSQMEVSVVTLNEFLPGLHLPVPEIIKIDAEGLDLEVLKGADHFFGITEIFMVEAAVVNKALDNSILKVMNFMDQHGYRFFDLTDLNRTQKHQALWLVELVFIKKDGMIDHTINSYN